jgi:hypothetical protein
MATPPQDALAAGRAYQQQLLSLLGSDDPAEVAAATASAVQSLLKEAGSDFNRRPAVGEWSVLELVGHLLDAEIVMSGRYRWTISQDKPPLLGYDQDQWVAGLRHNEAQPEDPQRARARELWPDVPDAGRA